MDYGNIWQMNVAFNDIFLNSKISIISKFIVLYEGNYLSNAISLEIVYQFTNLF